MVWDDRSRRRTELPRDWNVIRHDVLVRDRFECQIRGPRCIGRASECDHGAGGRHDHSRGNLRAACPPCHADRTSSQGHAAARLIREQARHPREAHPGLR